MDSPLRNLCCYFAARYIEHGDLFPQTLTANIINSGILKAQPICFSDNSMLTTPNSHRCGLSYLNLHIYLK